jgi:hypothetical protein
MIAETTSTLKASQDKALLQRVDLPVGYDMTQACIGRRCVGSRSRKGVLPFFLGGSQRL